MKERNVCVHCPLKDPAQFGGGALLHLGRVGSALAARAAVQCLPRAEVGVPPGPGRPGASLELGMGVRAWPTGAGMQVRTRELAAYNCPSDSLRARGCWLRYNVRLIFRRRVHMHTDASLDGARGCGRATARGRHGTPDCSLLQWAPF